MILPNPCDQTPLKVYSDGIKKSSQTHTQIQTHTLSQTQIMFTRSFTKTCFFF